MSRKGGVCTNKGGADIFLYQAYTASPSLRLLPAIVS